MITETCQRWTELRESRRPAGETIRTSAYDVAPISMTAARDFIRRHHYAREAGPVAHPFGLHDRGELVGTATFGPPPSTNAHNKVFPTLTQKEAVTLGRFVLVDAVPGNGESWFLARCFELLRERGVAAVESCSDPEPRTGADGVVFHRGHVGTIYQATNGCHVGKTDPETLYLLPDGSVFSKRAGSKVKSGERGAGKAIAKLVSFGADVPAADEDTIAWLARWKAAICRPMRHHGNYRYIWSLDKRRRREVLRFPALPYPKIGGV